MSGVTYFGRYELRTLLGAGGMGEVYEAFDHEQSRLVALKVLPVALASDEGFVERFKRESFVAAQLTDPHVIPIHRYGTIQGRLYIEMRLVRGADLAAIIERGGALSAHRAVSLVSQTAEALDAAHAENLVHRDVKPSNLLITTRDFLYLVDFGIAHAFGINTTGKALTATGATVGTLDYMAPERFMDRTEDGARTGVDPRVDVYSLACVLYECLSGTRPFPFAGLPALMHAHLSDLPPRPTATRPDLPPALDEVVLRGMAKDPGDRYPSAGALAADAAAAVRDLPPVRPSTTDPAGPGSHRLRTVTATAPPTQPAAARPGSFAAPPPSHTPAETPRPASGTATPPEPRHRSRRVRWMAVGACVAVVVALGAVLAGRLESGAPDDRSATTGEPAGPVTPDDQIVFALAGAPSTLDPLYATDGETFRVTRQMTEGLVTFLPGTADVAPALAQSWQSSPDGLTWSFNLREGARFHDGTIVDAQAVCFNLDRMYHQSGAGASRARYWTDTMGGFAGQVDQSGEPVPSVYRSCTAQASGTAVITLSRCTSKFPGILALPPFSIQSPTALQQYDANDVVAENDSFVYPAYATEHPTGTGPFRFQSYDRTTNTVTLVRNQDYWGQQARTQSLVFETIPDEGARRQQLQAGTIDAYDLPDPADWAALEAGGFTVARRPAFNVLYLGINQKNNPALTDLKVRQAIAYAVNRPQFVNSDLPEDSQVAAIFYPDTVDGWTDDVQLYDYDPQRARDLLAQAGADRLTVDFWWPTDVSRPYLPDPKRAFTALRADLEAVGITVNETSSSWNGGYLKGVENQQPDLFLLGWVGDYNTPDNFVGSFFIEMPNRFGTDVAPWGAMLSQDLTAADAIVDPDQRDTEYVRISKKLLNQYLPAVPISHSPAAIAISGHLNGLIPSPVFDEHFSTVDKS